MLVQDTFTDRTAMGCHAVMNTSFRRYRLFLSWAARSMFRTGGGINESIAKLVGSMAPSITVVIVSCPVQLRAARS